MSDWSWAVGTDASQNDEPHWFREQLEMRVSDALHGANPVAIERSVIEPHYLLGGNPSSASDIIVDQVPAEASAAQLNVGFESLTGPPERPGYRGVVQIADRLPALVIVPRRIRLVLTQRALAGIAEVDARFAFSSPAPRLPRALLRHEGFARALAGAMPFSPSVFIEPTTHGAELIVEIADARVHAGVGAAMKLVRALREAAIAIAGDADVLSAGGTDGLAADEDIAGLMEAVLNATAWLEGDVARVGNGVEARLVLEESMAQHKASLTASLVDKVVRLRLRAELPDHVESFALVPQRGWRSVLARISELQIDDAAVDDAYVITASHTAAGTLKERRLELLRLAERDSTIKCAPGTLEADIGGIAAAPIDVADAAGALLALWRGLVAAPTVLASVNDA